MTVVCICCGVVLYTRALKILIYVQMVTLFCRTLCNGNALSRKPIFIRCLAERDMHSEGFEGFFRVHVYI